MKYPKKYRGEKTLLKLPAQLENGKWKSGLLNVDGEIIDISGLAEHHTDQSCWVCCNAFNRRVGYSDEKVRKIIKSIKDGKGQKEKEERKKAKSKKNGKSKKKQKDKSKKDKSKKRSKDSGRKSKVKSRKKK